MTNTSVEVFSGLDWVGGKKYTFSSLFFKLYTLGQNYTSQDVKREVLYICKMICILKYHEGQYSVR